MMMMILMVMMIMMMMMMMIARAGHGDHMAVGPCPTTYAMQLRRHCKHRFHVLGFKDIGLAEVRATLSSLESKAPLPCSCLRLRMTGVEGHHHRRRPKQHPADLFWLITVALGKFRAFCRVSTRTYPNRICLHREI